MRRTSGCIPFSPRGPCSPLSPASQKEKESLKREPNEKEREGLKPTPRIEKAQIAARFASVESEIQSFPPQIVEIVHTV